MGIERIVVRQNDVWVEAYVNVETPWHHAAMPTLIDKEARRRIVAKYSDGTREQMLGEMIYMLYQAALLQVPLTEAQITRANELLAAWGWVAAVQAAAEVLKAEAALLNVEDLDDFDIAGSNHWPA